MKVVPAAISTTARAAGSSAARAMAASMPSGTPGLSAFTGGLSTVTTATSFWLSYRTRSGMGDIMTPPGASLEQRQVDRLAHRLITRIAGVQVIAAVVRR